MNYIRTHTSERLFPAKKAFSFIALKAVWPQSDPVSWRLFSECENAFHDYNLHG